MAYYAELDGVSGLALCASSLALPSNFELHYELFCLANGNSDYFTAPFNGRGIGFLSSFIAFHSSVQEAYFAYPAAGRPVIGDKVNLRITSTPNGDSTYTIGCYMSVNSGAEERLAILVGSDVFTQPLVPRPMEWGRRPNTLFTKVGVIRTRYYESGVLKNDWKFDQSSGNTVLDSVGSNHVTISGGYAWIYYDNGGETPVVIIEFSGSSTVYVHASANTIKLTTTSASNSVGTKTFSAMQKRSQASRTVRVNTASASSFTKRSNLTANARVQTSAMAVATKLASVVGNAVSAVSAALSVAKHVSTTAASNVIASAVGRFFGSSSYVKTYETAIQGRVANHAIAQGRVLPQPVVRGVVVEQSITDGHVK